MARAPSALALREQIDKDPRNWTRKPNGTGPFRLTEFTPGETIRLQRFDRYHLGPAKLDAVVFELGGGSLVTRYQNNELHVGGVPARVLRGVALPLSPPFVVTEEELERMVDGLAAGIQGAVG